LKQVQPLFPPPGGQRRAEEDHVDQTLGKEKWERWATDLPKQIGRKGSHWPGDPAYGTLYKLWPFPGAWSLPALLGPTQPPWDCMTCESQWKAQGSQKTPS
ncbi:hypothetical protein LEMLEM_LOCUS13335, partial [Lemmus lemmus]